MCVVCGGSSSFVFPPIMAHAASQLKKNRGEVDVNAIEDEKEKRTKSRRAASREQKRKVTDALLASPRLLQHTRTTELVHSFTARAH